MARRALTIELDESDFSRLVDAAEQQGRQPSDLAGALVRSGLSGTSVGDAQDRRKRTVEALRGLAEFRARLPQGEPIDVVELIREGREELDRRNPL